MVARACDLTFVGAFQGASRRVPYTTILNFCVKKFKKRKKEKKEPLQKDLQFFNLKNAEIFLFSMSNYIAKSNLTKLFRSSDRKTQPGELLLLETFWKTTHAIKNTRTCMTNESHLNVQTIFQEWLVLNKTGWWTPSYIFPLKCKCDVFFKIGWCQSVDG